jgi:hypothetical protein
MYTHQILFCNEMLYGFNTHKKYYFIRPQVPKFNNQGIQFICTTNCIPFKKICTDRIIIFLLPNVPNMNF